MTDEVFHEMLDSIKNLGSVAFKAQGGDTEGFDECNAAAFGLIEIFLAPYADRIKDGTDLMLILHGLLLLIKNFCEIKERINAEEK